MSSCKKTKMTSGSLTDAPVLTEAIPMRLPSENCHHTVTLNSDTISYGTAPTTLYKMLSYNECMNMSSAPHKSCRARMSPAITPIGLLVQFLDRSTRRIRLQLQHEGKSWIN